VIDNLLGVSGDLESIMGKALPEIKIGFLPEEKGKIKNEDKLF
jgi:hypothetical protein